MPFLESTNTLLVYLRKLFIKYLLTSSEQACYFDFDVFDGGLQITLTLLYPKSDWFQPINPCCAQQMWGERMEKRCGMRRRKRVSAAWHFTVPKCRYLASREWDSTINYYIPPRIRHRIKLTQDPFCSFFNARCVGESWYFWYFGGNVVLESGDTDWSQTTNGPLCTFAKWRHRPGYW